MNTPGGATPLEDSWLSPQHSWFLCGCCTLWVSLLEQWVRYVIMLQQIVFTFYPLTRCRHETTGADVSLFPNAEAESSVHPSKGQTSWNVKECIKSRRISDFQRLLHTPHERKSWWQSWNCSEIIKYLNCKNCWLVENCDNLCYMYKGFFFPKIPHVSYSLLLGKRRKWFITCNMMRRCSTPLYSTL